MSFLNSKKQANSKTREDDYLLHKSEPNNFRIYEIPSDVEEELLVNRFFLKRRVWKNMEKIKRAQPRHDNYASESKNRKLKFRYQH